MTLLKVKNLCKDFVKSGSIFQKPTVIHANKNINLKLEKGKTLAIVGESGSGKSTLARQIIGIEKPTKGKILLNDRELNFKNQKDQQYRFNNIRMIFQNPYDSLNPNVRIGNALDQTLKINTPLNKKQRQKKIDDTLVKVGLMVDDKHKYPRMFSGGQRQRIAIARAIILEPSIIIADEPLSALDVSIQSQIINLIQSLQEEMGISFIFISHELNIVEHIADTILVMYHGQVVEYGNVSQIFDEPLHPYTQALFASTPIYKKRFPNFLPQGPKKPARQNENICPFYRRCQYCETRCLNESPRLVETHKDYKIACFKFE